MSWRPQYSIMSDGRTLKVVPHEFFEGKRDLPQISKYIWEWANRTRGLRP